MWWVESVDVKPVLPVRHGGRKYVGVTQHEPQRKGRFETDRYRRWPHGLGDGDLWSSEVGGGGGVDWSLESAAAVEESGKKNPRQPAPPARGYGFLAGGKIPTRTRDPYGLPNP